MEQLIEPDSLTALRHAVDEALLAPPVPGCERPHNRLVPLRWSDRAIELILDDPTRSRRIADTSSGRDLRWILGYASIKDPRSQPLWWHQDWRCWNHPVSYRRAAPQVALLLYLTNTDSRTGALRVLPGSHRASVPLHAALAAAHRHVSVPAEHDSVLRDQPGQVTLSVAAGDAVMLDYRLLHGTHPNDSDGRRDCLLLSFTPDWSGLPADIRGHLIQHLALPVEHEHVPDGRWRADLLPQHDGARIDLALERAAPAEFTASG